MNNLEIIKKPFLYNESFKDQHSPWAGHKLFARDLIGIVKPKTVVELGTYKGTSFLSFCEGDLLFNNKANLYAIDTWEEDSHSGKYDGLSIKKSLKQLLEKYYSGVYYELIQAKFDDVVNRFEDLSIDILHIDGWHTYEAVSNDYNTWKNKVSENGLILFHDINVSGGDFGVKKFWGELIQKFPKQHLEFNHSNGLGILFMSENKFGIDEGFSRRNFEYLNFNYELVKTELYNCSIKSKELDEIKGSKYWKIKEKIKSILGR